VTGASLLNGRWLQAMWIETTALRHPPSLRFGAAAPSYGGCRAEARRAKAGRCFPPFVYQLGFDVFTVEKPGQHRQGVPFRRMIPKSVKRFSDKIMRKQKVAGSFSGQDVAF
jgi:hypothetical protein